MYHDTDDILVLKTIDASATREALRHQRNEVSSIRNIPVYEFSETDFFNTAFQPIFSVDSITRYAEIDDYFVFSSTVEALQFVISNYQNGNTFSQSDAFNSAMLYMSDESSFISVSNSKKLEQQYSEVFNISHPKSAIASNFISIFQGINDDNFTHINGVTQQFRSRRIANTISEEFSVALDADIITDPQFVDNHQTRGKDIAVQDINNVLYLISNSGKILWKKQLNGTILGKIEQVDLYKNGRLQMAFATSKRVYVLDRNGNNVSPFPLKFNDDITQPLSVFDYDKNKRYRFMVTQGQNILLYDKTGKIVKGFNYRNSGSIKTQPKHFRISNKDYIVFAAGDKMQILDRRGKIRINTNDAFDFSGQPIYAYKKPFYHNQY